MTFLTRDVGMICWMMIRSLRPSTDSIVLRTLSISTPRLLRTLAASPSPSRSKPKQQVLCADVGVVRSLCLFLGERENLLRPFGEALERVQNRLHCPSGPPVDGRGQSPGTAVTSPIVPVSADS